MELRSPAATGDIVLTSPPRKNCNLLFQFIARFRRAEHSHVGIALYQFNIIHAMPGSGIHMQETGDFLEEFEDFFVYRLRQAQCEDKAVLLEEHLRHHHLQRYSLLTVLRASWRQTFCSELAAKAYAQAGLVLTEPERKPNRTFPSDIARHIAGNPNWIDVTQEYREFFLNKDNRGLLKHAALIEQTNVTLTQLMGYGQQVAVDRVNSANSHRTLHAPILTPPMNYWSNRLAQPSTIKIRMMYWRRMLKDIIQFLRQRNE